MPGFYAYIWLIPLLPGLGALANGLFGKRVLPKALVSLVACGTVFASFVLSVGAVYQLRKENPLVESAPRVYEGWPRIEVDSSARRVEVTVYQWIGAGTFHTREGAPAQMNVPVAYQVDPLSAIMLMVVTGVGFLIHVYSVGYMGHEKGYYRYFTYLNLFMFSMLNLVLGNNFLIMFVGWEGVGLCSYLLIGFYFDKDFAATAGKKAFVVNRIGDFGFVLGLMTCFWVFGTLDFSDIMKAVNVPGAFTPGDATLTAVALLLFLGATGKSAQIPLYVWLPDAMAGPTPVSALIHAATMVTSGIYMIVRCNPIFLHAPLAMAVVACVAAATAFVAASIGLVQNDIKKVLAYSTVSQLGYMFLALGVGAFSAGVFHLMTHAFFKALLFLGSGSVIHAMSGEQDIRKMGGLHKKIPVTSWTFLIGCVAIAGVPPLAGFFSKDEILWRAFSSHVLPTLGPYLWGVGAVTAFMTAFYMWRLYFVTFTGECRADEETKHHIHESPGTMLVPLVVLAILSIVGGWVGIPHSISSVVGGKDINVLEHWLRPVLTTPAEELSANGGSSEHGAEPVEGGEHAAGEHKIHEHAAPPIEYALMGASVVLAFAGIGLAYAFYGRPSPIPAGLAAGAKGLYQLLLNKYWVDEIYELAVVNHMKWWCARAGDFDRLVIDGIVDGVATVTRGFSSLSIMIDQYIVDFLVDLVGYTCEWGSHFLRRAQTGYVQNYIYVSVLAMLGILGIYGFWAVTP
ncbi:MAG: NADH-quinone oxidoreductase subunit L [Acidobacteriota bacterium]